MFGRLFGSRKEKKSEDDNSILLAFIALKPDTVVDSAAIRTAIRQKFPSKSPLKDSPIEKGIFIEDFDGYQMTFCHIPMPIPWGDLEGPCATAWWWPEATSEMKPHKSHIMLAITRQPAGFTRLQYHILISQMIATVLANVNAAGVYWGRGTLVYPPARYLEEVAELSDDNFNPMLWVDMRLQVDKGTSRFFTTGLSSFGKLEIEIDKTHMDPAELLSYMGDLIIYILKNDITLKDGETIGRDAVEKFPVHYKKSLFGRGQVMKIEIP